MTAEAILAGLETPLWALDVAGGTLLWSNPAADRLLAEGAIEALRRGALSRCRHARLEDLYAALEAEGPCDEVWTVGPASAPRGLRCRCTILRDDPGRKAILVEGRGDPEPALAEGSVVADGGTGDSVDSLFHRAALPMLVVDLDDDGRILGGNEAAARLYRLEREALLKRALWQLDSRGRAVLNELESALRRESAPWGRSCLHRAPGELARSLEVHVVPLARDEPSKVLAILIDVSDDRRLARESMAHQEALERLVAERDTQLTAARRAAEAANEAKSNFLANMSHEIRTPLHAIFGMAQLIRRDSLTPRQTERLDKLDVASRHLADVISSILDLSSIESGKVSLSDDTFELNALVRRVMSMLEGQAIAKGLRFVCEVSTPDILLQGDATRLQQALLNLADNAVKFTHSGGITLRAIVEHEDAGKLGLRFEVRDTGIGVAPDLMARLFSPFEQADNSSTRSYRGVGIGLAITRRIARLMGGDAGGRSEEGQGSTFWLSVTLLKAAPVLDAAWLDTAPAEEILRRDYSGCRVLLVEDDLINREIAMLMLAEAGQFFDVASDGEQAVMLAARSDYDLILMDLQLPKLSGQEATRRIRELPNGRRVPIIALTADVFAEDRESCFAAGMNDFVAKPMTFDVFCRTLLRWLAGRRRLESSPL
ncbi:MAG: response regulator [Rhodocyclaceae bacterium]|nr:response regulator [Rhodocyclaceae bacterium]